MKIALFSDIHANLPALQACLQSIDDRQPDSVYCLGDLVGYNVWPNEVVNEIRKRGIPTIAGNYDQGVGLNSDDCGCAYKTTTEKEMGSISINYTNATINAAERNYLRTLPAQIKVSFHFDNRPLQLLLVHGSPRRINEYLFEDRDERNLLRMMEQAGADILCFGHTHKPWHKVLSENQQSYEQRHAINIGSVGKPKDGNAQGCYVLLTIEQDMVNPANPAITVEFVRFDYDIEKAARGVEESPLPNEYAAMLRKGY